METNQVLIGVVVVIVLLVVFPVVYSQWPRDPKPEVDGPVIERFHAAIVQYRQDFGMLPKRLDQLAPQYMAEIPLASNRKPFEYDPNTGQVSPPYPKTPETVEFFKDSNLPAATGSPMGEVMTGIGIRNELNY